MNLANKLTLLRILLAAIFMRFLFLEPFWAKGLCLGLFLLASLTDYWDGRIARRLGQITQFGKLMDPIADKVLTLSAFIGFVQLSLIPGWMVLLIMLRDLLITGVRLGLPQGSEKVAARRSGKHKTAVQFVAIVFILVIHLLKGSAVWKSGWDPVAAGFIYWGMMLVVIVTLASGLWVLYINREAFFGGAKHID